MAIKEYPMTPSTIETIDLAIYKLINEDFDLHTKTNTGFKKVPVLWMSPERAVNSKDKDIRDSVGKLKLPLITVDRTKVVGRHTYSQIQLVQEAIGNIRDLYTEK